MTRQGYADVACPECGREVETRYYSSINVTLNPEDKEAALNGTLSMFKCPDCGYETPINTDFLYHDMREFLMIHVALTDEGVADAFNSFEMIANDDISKSMLDCDYKFRIVRSTNQLKEKVVIFESGLDDRIMELCKVILVSMLVEQGQELPDYEDILFAGESENGEGYVMAFVGEAGGTVTLPKEVYDSVKSTNYVPEEMPKDICIIDFDWARDVLLPTGDNDEVSGSEPAEDQGEHVGNVRVVSIFDMAFRFPDNFTIMKPLPEDGDNMFVMVSQDEGTLALLKVNTIPSKKAMAYKKPQKVIDGIHESLEDDQGLIEVGSGKCGYSGCDYIYSIVKTKQEPFGVQYCLLLHIKRDGYSIEVLGFFDETGTTGLRDSTVFEIKRREGLVDVGEDGFVGWSRDPYDESRIAGFLANISESSEFDGMFPEHPLSEARATLKTLVENN